MHVLPPVVRAAPLPDAQGRRDRVLLVTRGSKSARPPSETGQWATLPGTNPRRAARADLLPFDAPRRLARQVKQDSVDSRNLIGNARGNAFKDVIRQPCPVRC